MMHDGSCAAERPSSEKEIRGGLRLSAFPWLEWLGHVRATVHSRACNLPYGGEFSKIDQSSPNGCLLGPVHMHWGIMLYLTAHKILSWQA